MCVAKSERIIKNNVCNINNLRAAYCPQIANRAENNHSHEVRIAISPNIIYSVKGQASAVLH